MYLEIVLISISLVLSGFFSSSETALTSLNELRTRKAIDDHPFFAKPLRMWLNRPEMTLATILIGNNLVNIFSSALATGMALTLFEHNAIAAATGVMTLLILMFGEIIPKTFAKRNPMVVTLAFIYPIYIINTLVYPLSLLLSFISSWLSSWGEKSNGGSNPTITSDELEFIVDASLGEGAIEEETHAMLSSIFDMQTAMVKEIMVPRTEIVFLNSSAPPESNLDTIEEHQFSRYPVHSGNIDEISGIFYVKDLVKSNTESILQNIESSLKDKSTLHVALHVPETKTISSLLADMRSKSRHIALVVDEYGGLSGIVTMEDILEEIVGEIYDEYDEKDIDYIKIGSDTYIVDSRMNLEDFFEVLGVHMVENDKSYDTVGGLVFDIAGDIPTAGQKMYYQGYSVTVKTMTGTRIGRVEFKKSDTQHENNDSYSDSE